jgi:hypothetical protein
MTPYELRAMRLVNESKIKALTTAVIVSIAVTTVVLLILSPILLPLWILEKAFLAIKSLFTPKKTEVRNQFKNARRK